jgi:hypothetical protein
MSHRCDLTFAQSPDNRIFDPRPLADAKARGRNNVFSRKNQRLLGGQFDPVYEWPSGGEFGDGTVIAIVISPRHDVRGGAP